MSTETENQNLNPAEQIAREQLGAAEQQAASGNGDAPANAEGSLENGEAATESPNLLDNPMNYAANAGKAAGRLTPSGVALTAVNLLRNNKGKMGIAGTLIAAIVVIGLYGGTLFLPSFTANAEKTLGGPANATLAKLSGRMGAYSRIPGVKRLFKNVHFEANVQKLGQDLKAKGYSFNEDGSLTTPEGTILTEAEDIESEFAKFADGPLVGSRSRNKVAKTLRERLALSAEASASGDLEEPKEGETPEEAAQRQAVEQSREGAIDGDGTEPTAPDVAEAKKSADSGEAKDAVDEADKKADELEADGTKNADIDISTAPVAGATDEELGEIVDNLPEDVSGTPGLSKVSAFVDISDKVCTIGKAARAAYVVGLVIKRYQLIKVFTVLLNNSDAIKTGQINGKLLGQLMPILLTNNKGASITGSGGYRFLSGDTSARPSEASTNLLRTDRQNLGGVMNAIIGFISIEPVNTFCKNVQNPLAQGGLAAVELAVLAGSVFGGPEATAGAVTAEQGVKMAIAKAVGKAIAWGVTEQAGMFVAQSYVKSYIGKFFSGNIMPFNPNKTSGGPYAGDVAAAGAGSFYELSGRATGNTALTRSAYVDIMRDVHQQERDRYAHMSLFERFAKVGPSNTNSLLGLALVDSPFAGGNTQAVAQNAIASITNFDVLKNVQRFASVSLSSSAYAQDGDMPVNDKGYVTDPFGNLIVGNNFDGMDPVKNYETLEKNNLVDENGDPQGSLKKYVDDCAQAVAVVKDTSNTIKDECVGGATKSYQLFLATYAYASSLEAVYSPDIGDTSAGTSSSGTTGASGVVAKKGTATSSLPCPVGSADGTQLASTAERVVTVAGNIKRKLCDYGGVKGVDASWSDMANLLASAKKNGQTLGGGGFRTAESQIQLRKNHCGKSQYAIYEMDPNSCDPPTAIPGTSNHELGLAIDFSSCSSHSTGCYKWLAANAARFNIKNLPREPWHWSYNGH